ncbi:hypothetical protein PFISCL1PPCAC_1038, partial [Pristionchus fissidentatus]
PKSSIFNPFQQATNLGKKLSKGQRYRLNRRMRATAGADVLKTIGDARAAAGIGGGWYGASAGQFTSISFLNFHPLVFILSNCFIFYIAGSMYGSAMADEVVTTMGNC